MIKIITKVSQIIADFLIKENIISKEYRDTYIYGFELCISSVISFVFVVLIAIITRMYIECTTFYIVFCVTRLFCGGYHADTYLRCKIMFSAVLLIELLIFQLINNLGFLYWVILYLFSSTIICNFSPVENSNKKLTLKDKRKARRITFVLLFLWLLIMVVIFIYNLSYQIIPLTLLSVAVLMLLGIIKERRKSR